MVRSRHHNAGENHNLLTADKSFKNVAKFKYLGARVTNQNSIHEEIKSILNSESACCHSVQSLLSFHFLSKNLKDQNTTHKTNSCYFVRV
jgi:hypothetical protein